MTWISTYNRRLAELTARNDSAASMYKSPLENARDLMAANKGQYNYNALASTGEGPDFSPGNIAGNIGSGAWSAAKGAINFIERPLYGILGATKAAMDDPNNKDQNPFIRLAMSGSGLGLAANIATQPEAFWKGISGETHTTSSDIYNKHLPGYETWNPVGKFALGLGTDIAFDPLTYVGPGAIKALWKGGFKAAGKMGVGSGVAPKLGRATNTTASATPEPKPVAITPSSLIKKDLAATGKAQATDEAATKFTDHLAKQATRNQPQPAKTTPYDITFSSNAQKDILNASQPKQSASELVDRAMLNVVSKGLNNLKTKLHPKDIDIEPIYREVPPTPVKTPKTSKTPKVVEPKDLSRFNNPNVGMIKTQDLADLVTNRKLGPGNKGIQEDIRSGKGITTPLIVLFDPVSNRMAIGNGIHRLESALAEGLEELPVVVQRSTNAFRNKAGKEFKHPLGDKFPDEGHPDLLFKKTPPVEVPKPKAPAAKPKSDAQVYDEGIKQLETTGVQHQYGLYDSEGNALISEKTGGHLTMGRENLHTLLTDPTRSKKEYFINAPDGVTSIKEYARELKDAYKALNDVPEPPSFASQFDAEMASKAVSKGAKGASKATKAPEQAAAPAVEAAVLRRMNPGEAAIWRSKHLHLTTEEVQTIFKARSPQSAADRIADIKLARAGATTKGEIKSFSGLESAISSGAIDAKDPAFQKAIQKIVASTGIKQTGTKGQAAASRKVEAAFARLAKAEEGKTRISPEDLKTVADQLTKERLGKLIDNPVAEQVSKQVISTKSLAAAVIRGDTSVFSKTKIVLDEAQHAAVQRVMQRGAMSQIVEPKGWPFRTNKLVPRTSKTPGLGDAKHPAMNMRSQYTIGRDILEEATKLLPAKIAGEVREAELYKIFMPMLHAAEQMLRQSGLPIILGNKATGLPLSLHDIFSALPRQFVEHYFLNVQSAIDVSHFGEITEQLVRLSKKEITPLQFDEATFKILGAPRKLKAETLAKTGPQFSNYASMAKWKKHPEDFIVNAQEAADAFKASAVNIYQALTRNSAETIVNTTGKAQKLSDDAMQLFAKTVLDDNVMPSDIIGVFSNPANLIEKAAVGVGEIISSDAKNLAKIQLEIRMAEVLDGPGVHIAAKAAEKYSKLMGYKKKGGMAAFDNERALIASEMFRAADEEAAMLMREAGFATTDLGMRAEFANYITSLRAFAPHVGNESLRPKLLGYHNLAQRETSQYTTELSKISRLSTVEQQAEAFRYLQKGTGAVEPEIAQLSNEISKLWNRVLGDTDNKFGFIGRNGITGEELADKFRHFQINAKEFPIDYKDVANSWKQWDVKDPLNLASKVHAAAQAVIAERTVGASFTMNFGEKVWKPGLVKILNTGGSSRIARLIDTSQYYPKDIAQQMHLIDKTLEEFAKPASSSKLLRTLDSIQHALKAGFTIYNPGHHIRNMNGDITLSFNDGMTNPKHYAKGHAVMASRNGAYEGIDFIAAAKVAGIEDIGKSQSHVMYKGKRIELSPSQEYNLGYDVGMYPSYTTLEDIGTNASRAGGDFISDLRTKSPLKGKVQKVAAGVSEWRDHWVRASQFNWLIDGLVLDSTKPLDQALRMAAEKASARVRKVHPDGSDLSEMERKVMRRGIMFYSWIRKAIPLVATAMVQRPGRVMMYPKATYDMAEAQGIDLQSFGDQFPTDQLFPDWMQDGTQGVMFGEPGNYWGTRTGNPASDVMDQYGTNPATTFRTIMGSINPLYRVPFELAAGSGVGTGAKIRDKSEYVDSQIPQGGFISKMVGRSASSGFSQPLTVAPSNENYVPTIPVWLQQLLNKNLGTGIIDMSKPSYIKQGQFAARDAARDASLKSGGSN